MLAEPGLDPGVLLHHLNVARMRSKFLPAKHPSVQEAAKETLQIIQQLLIQTPAIVIVMRGGEVFFNNRRLPKESIRHDGLIQAFDHLGIHALHITRGVDDEELTQFIDLCFVRGLAQMGTEQIRQVLAQQPFTHIHLNREDILAGESQVVQDEGPVRVPISEARDTYQQAIKATVEAYYDSQRGGKVDMPLVFNIVDDLQNGLLENADLYFAMSQLREFSEYTFYHSVNVAIISMLLGKGIGLQQEQVNRLGVAAMLHDLGKARVPIEILEKPGRLDPEERKIMEEHPLDSVKILMEQQDIFPAALAVAAQHHAKYDMTGYPDFKGFGTLHLFSHITTIADVYDALRSARSYKAAMLPDKSMEIMLSESGTTFHPVLLKAFFRMVGFYPVGSTVELDTGEFAIVTKSNPKHPLRPEVKVIPAPGLSASMARTIDLAEPTEAGVYPRTILRTVDAGDYGIRVAKYL